MATSIIKAPITNYVVVVETGTTSATVASKLATLKTALVNLSSDRRYKAFIMIGSGVYNIQNISGYQFANINFGNDRFIMGCISLGSSQHFYEYLCRASGITVNDLTSNTSTSNYQLCYWI